jgi:ferredoxin-NADP reductase
VAKKRKTSARRNLDLGKMRRRQAELIDSRMLSASVRSLVFRTRDGSPVGHLPGQYLDLFVPTAIGLPFRRPYSIASAPDGARPDVFEIAVTRVDGGPTSDALHALPVGGVVEMDGPEGTFVLRADDRAFPALFVATGTGLAPLRAMLGDDLRTPDGPPRVLLFGCRTPADILWAEELAEWERGRSRFAVHVTLSRPPPDWRGKTGYVQRYICELFETLPGARAYVCGLSAMVDDVVQRLGRDCKVPRERVRYETYD